MTIFRDGLVDATGAVHEFAQIEVRRTKIRGHRKCLIEALDRLIRVTGLQVRGAEPYERKSVVSELASTDRSMYE